MMEKMIRGRESGVILLTLVLVVIVVFGITGSVLMVSLSEAKAVTETTNQRTAFYLAEGGLEGAKWEIGESTDPDKDGMGNRTTTTTQGTYSVTAQDLGGGSYQLTSTGTTGPSSVTLEAVINTENTTRFPLGATTMLGHVDKTKIKFRNDFGLILDGGQSPAVVVTDDDLYGDIGSKLADAVNKKKLPLTNITGTPSAKFGAKGKEVELPVYLETDYPTALDDLSGLYTQLVDTVSKTIIPKAEVFKAATNVVDKKSGKKVANQYSFGTSSSPATVYMPSDVTLETGEKISGYGTLVVGDKLQLKSGSALDWHGHVIVMGDAKAKANLQVDGTFTVDGNVVVLGEAKESAEFKVSSKAKATIDGSFLAASDYLEKGKEVKVTMDGELNVNGLFTLIGMKVSTKFKDDSDFNLNGMLQMAIPESNKKTKLTFSFDGFVEIHKDDDQIQNGADALAELGAKWNISEIGTLLTSEVTTYSWRQVSS